jgi:hypothetical protein
MGVLFVDSEEIDEPGDNVMDQLILLARAIKIVTRSRIARE